jgi:predicted alpha/beta-fold hydrolase
MIRLAAEISRRGYRVARMDMRGCGAGLLLARGVFHADRSGDLLAAVRYLASRFPESPITICGFSLGANLTLKMLGEVGADLPRQIDSALAVAPPIDLSYCCHKLAHGAGWIYDRFFARLLWQDFRQRRSLLAGADRIPLRRAPATLLSFDRQITAPLAGFDSADAYYRSASAAGVLCKIPVPTVILSAVDDPIVPQEIYGGVPRAPGTQLFVIEGGGHLGFYATPRQATSTRRWLDQRLVDWMDEVDQHHRRDALQTNRAAQGHVSACER